MDWDEKLLKVFDIPANILPSVKCSSTVLCRCEKDGVLDQVAVAGILGDQQAALFGQACYKEGEAKCTYGTGCFLMMNTGPEPLASHPGLLTTVAYQLEGQPPVYALEGAVSVCGSLVQWLRDQLQIIESAKQTQDLVQACGPGGSEGLVVVPAFSGLFAPYWREDARGVICGLTAFHEKKHMVKACLEAASFQAMDVLDAMAKDAGHALANLKVD
jgi:glycerol kinase